MRLPIINVTLLKNTEDRGCGDKKLLNSQLMNTSSNMKSKIEHAIVQHLECHR